MKTARSTRKTFVGTGMSILIWGSALVAPTVSNSEPSDTSADESCDYTLQRNVGVPMRDGTLLRADVYRPETETEVPVTLVRTQYDKTGDTAALPSEHFAENCYIAVAQDVRGQYASEGDFYEFAAEQEDGYDTVEWAARIPGSNGKVGMWGTSYVGATQWMAASQTPPHLTTIIPAFTSASYNDGWTYQDGAWSLAFQEAWPADTIVRSAAAHRGDLDLYDEITEAGRPSSLEESYWHLPLQTYPPFQPDSDVVAPYFYDWIEHNTNDEYWQRWAPEEHYDNVDVPVLNIGGWYDVFLNGTLDNFNGMRRQGGSDLARDNQHVVIGTWTHGDTDYRRLPWQNGEPPEERVPWSSPSSVDYGPASAIDEQELQLAWFDHWLKGENNEVDDMPPVSYFLMGANEWQNADDWPLPDTQWRDYYLTSDGNANSRHGDGGLIDEPGTGNDRYTYDPANPVESMGGHSCCDAATTPMGPGDQRDIEDRDDVLVYSTPELEEDMEVTGPITVTLYASSSATDTDFTAKLVDVDPDGKAINLNDGIVRARFRDSLTDPELIERGEVYKYEIEVWPTSNLFKEGHQVRLEISSSNFPMYDRNPNTGNEFGKDAAMRKAHQTIFHNDRYPSHMTLPVIPEGD